MLWPFAKFVGCGNDFILIDNRLENFPLHRPQLISKLCHRQFGIGGDGIILLQSSQKADFRMRIFNPDNTEGEMCGNGLRCFVKWIESLGYKKGHYLIETLHGEIKAFIQDDSFVQVHMGNPKDIQWNVSLKFLGQTLIGHYLNTGVPHVVIFVENVEHIDVQEWGAALRHHSHWGDRGANVNFVEQVSNQKLKIRTYERGVEGETLACGTGATASALAAAFQNQISNPIIVETRSKENLLIDFSRIDDQFLDVSMSGPAKGIYCGQIDLDSF
jgi:diaminopimelate epimerase